jgi:hypothetical protein
VGLCSCIDALNQPHDDDIETAEGVVNEVNDSSGSRRIFKTNEKVWIRTLLRTVMLRMVLVIDLLLRTQNVKYVHTLEGTTVESLLTQLADELLIQDITEPSAVLDSLSDDELQTTYDHVLEQFALELLIGADKNSGWSNGKLVIDANHGPIHLLQAVFYAVKLEVQRRGAAVCCLGMSAISAMQTPPS